jgi:hypothetical protein
MMHEAARGCRRTHSHTQKSITMGDGCGVLGPETRGALLVIWQLKKIPLTYISPRNLETGRWQVCKTSKPLIYRHGEVLYEIFQKSLPANFISLRKKAQKQLMAWDVNILNFSIYANISSCKWLKTRVRPIN